MSQISGTTMNDQKRQLIMWTLLGILPVTGMAVDLISPSLPAIAASLNVSDSLVKNTISVYLVGYAFGNFFTGILTDAIGRRNLLNGGLIAFTLVSLLPIFFPSISVLLLSRLLQGWAIGTAAVVIRAIFSDILPPEKLVKNGVLIGTMWGFGPVIGPFLGGYLQSYFDWEACFVFFSVSIAIAFSILYFILPETHQQRSKLNTATIKRNLIEVLTNRKFMGLTIMMGAAYSLMITFNTVGPFLIQNKMHYSPVNFGHIAFFLGLTFLSATLTCRFLLNRFKVDNLFKQSLTLFFAFILIALIVTFYLPDEHIVLLCSVSAVMFFATGFIFPLSMGQGLSMFRHIAGTASATMYLVNILMTSLVGLIVSVIDVQGISSLFAVFFILIALCLLAFFALIHSKAAA